VSHLQKHVKSVHEGVKNYECPHCKYRASQKGAIQQHVRAVHNQIKDFECPSCDYRASQKGAIQQHVKAIHNQIKDFECPSCDYRASQKGAIQQHVKICTGGRIGSSGEVKIKIMLEEMRIPYQYNASHEVRDKGLLRWDFIIQTQDGLIFMEYDGKQHFEPSTFGGMSKEKAQKAFATQQHRDKIKTDYCRDNGQPLLRIPYTDFANIPDLVVAFILEHMNEWGFE
jgi:KRAB domain-containing zinc finger protein